MSVEMIFRHIGRWVPDMPAVLCFFGDVLNPTDIVSRIVAFPVEIPLAPALNTFQPVGGSVPVCNSRLNPQRPPGYSWARNSLSAAAQPKSSRSTSCP